MNGGDGGGAPGAVPPDKAVSPTWSGAEREREIVEGGREGVRRRGSPTWEGEVRVSGAERGIKMKK